MRFTSYSSAIEKNYNVLGGGKETEIKTKGIFYNKKFTDTNELKLAESSLTLYFSQFFFTLAAVPFHLWSLDGLQDFTVFTF